MKLFWYAIIFMLCTPALASEQILSLDKYFQGTCQDYSGTWQGFMTDPTDLFDNGGPWPVTVSLYQLNGKIWGRTSAVKLTGKRAIFKSNEIWARCNDGKLQDIFWGANNSCGTLSQQGGLISKNVLALRLNWENAMNSASLLLFLQRKNNLTPYYESSHMNAYDPAGVKTCH